MTTSESRSPPTRPTRLVIVTTAAAVVLVVACVLVLAVRQDSGGSDQEADGTAPAAGPADPTSEEVALGFLDAYGVFDANGALSFLADDADLNRLWEEHSTEFAQR